MKKIISFICKIFIYIENKKNNYIFNRSKQFVTSWGIKSYGEPEIICFDGISRLVVGDYTSIANKVSILLGSNHKLGLVTTFPRSLVNPSIPEHETNEQGDVVIGSDVWIGYRVTIIGPVTIGHGAIVGAGALVVGHVPPYAVVGGVPARVIKYRFPQDEIDLLLSNPWWKKTEEDIRKIENLLYSNNVKEFIKSLKEL